MEYKDIPLIHTIKGNIPIADLEYKSQWHDDSSNTIFTESYYLNGELVKQSAHILAKQGNEAVNIASALV